MNQISINYMRWGFLELRTWKECIQYVRINLIIRLTRNEVDFY